MNDTPTVKATISPGYRWRLVLICLMMLGFGAYCIYDWQIGYPLKQQQYEEFTQIKEDNPKTFPEVWAAYAAERGWPTSSSKLEDKSDVDILVQLIMALICVPLGLFFLFKLVRENLRWVAMDETGISASGGHRVAWDAIQSLDETRWATKGIAWLHYTDASGKEHRLLLDDFKSQRDPIKQIVTKVQNLLKPPSGDDDTAGESPDAESGASEDQPHDAESVSAV
ncbi:MAG: hypothetical protein AAF333_12345 [Planctomycetota bacterium]